MKIVIGKYTVVVKIHNTIDLELSDILNNQELRSPKISAIKRLREYRSEIGGDSGLKTCKEYVERLELIK